MVEKSGKASRARLGRERGGVPPPQSPAPVSPGSFCIAASFLFLFAIWKPGTGYDQYGATNIAALATKASLAVANLVPRTFPGIYSLPSTKPEKAQERGWAVAKLRPQTLLKGHLQTGDEMTGDDGWIFSHFQAPIHTLGKSLHSARVTWPTVFEYHRTGYSSDPAVISRCLPPRVPAWATGESVCGPTSRCTTVPTWRLAGLELNNLAEWWLNLNNKQNETSKQRWLLRSEPRGRKGSSYFSIRLTASVGN